MMTQRHRVITCDDGCVVDNPNGITGVTFTGLEITRIDTIFMVSFLRVG